MTNHRVQGLQLHLALGLLSASLVAFQLEQMQLLALVQWHHFAYLIISVALLGFGAAGTVIALFKAFFLRNIEILLPLLMFCCSCMMALALPLSQGLVSSFDVSLLFIDPAQAGLLLAGQAVYLLVFFLGALPIGLVFVQFSSRIGGLYCANLIGSGAGGALVVVGMYFLLPRELPGLTALLPWTAGLLVSRRVGIAPLLAACLSLALISVLVIYPPDIQPSQYKAISRVLDLPEAKKEAGRPSPYGLVQLVTAPALRYAPGLSLTYTDEVAPVRAAVFNNGDWFGAVQDDYLSLQDATPSALPYAMARRQKVLVLSAGTGSDIIHALARGAGSVTAVEQHRRAMETAVDSYDKGISRLTENPKVRFSHSAPRTWLAGDSGLYDLVTVPVVGSFGGSSGLFALQEQNLLTMEGFQEIWRHLSANGVVRVSAWLDSPPRSSLRLAATIVESLEEIGVEPGSHIAAIRGWDMITFIVKRSALTDDDVQKIRDFCEELQFDPVVLPGLQAQERYRYHSSAGRDFFGFFDVLFLPEQRAEFYATYPFNLRPTSDNRPFFSQFLQWKSTPFLVRQFGEHAIPFLEMGYVLVLISFVQMAAAAVFLILLPLLRLRVPDRRVVQQWTIPFFSGLGLGYMFFEIVLIHELVLYLGNPIFAAATVISCLLIFSGLGSLYSSRLSGISRSHSLAACVVALLLLLYLFVLPWALHAGIGLSTGLKLLFLLVLLAPPSFVMGMPFPLGLSRVADYSKSQAAWAWGINGSVSVVSAGLAAIIAVELGFSAVMLIACGAYFVAALAGYMSCKIEVTS